MKTKTDARARILEVLDGTARRLTVSEIAILAGCSPSRVNDIIRPLMREGLVVRDAEERPRAQAKYKGQWSNAPVVVFVYGRTGTRA